MKTLVKLKQETTQLATEEGVVIIEKYIEIKCFVTVQRKREREFRLKFNSEFL